MLKRKKVAYTIVLIIIVLLTFLIYKLDSNPALFIKTAIKPSKKYVATVLPKDTLQLFDYRGELESDTAYVFVQGGPALKRNIDEKNPLLLLPNSHNLLRVHPIQTQMMNSTILRAKPILTQQEGDFEHNQNVEILHRTVSYLKNRGKTVYVVCHSYGTLIGHQYLNTKENKTDKIVLMGFPLNMNLKTFDVDRGEIIRWVDGVKPLKESPFPSFPLKFLINESLNDVFANMFRLIETNAKKRYTELLEDKDLSNIIYVYGKFDEASGRPSNSELNFLKSKEVTVVETFGDHHSMWTSEFMESLYENFATKNPIKKSIISRLDGIIENNGIDYGLKWFQKAKDSSVYASPVEEELNFYGYQLLDSKKKEEAIEIFKLSTELFPNSSNAFDSLAEAYLKIKNNELAIKNYEKAVELDPKNDNAKKSLKQLKNAQ